MELSVFSDEYWMKQALLQAEQGFAEGEIPVGAVVVAKHRVIAKAYNQVERLQDVTAHAEMIALTSAQNHLGSKYLNECALYVTLEPCVMCAGALYWSQIGKLVIGARDPKRGFDRLEEPLIHPKTTLQWDVLREPCEVLVKDFFRQMRGNNK
ncbi:MAG: nucleoside deaminase [Bacteroidota bacterium]